MLKIIELFKALTTGEKLLPSSTGFEWWENVYTSNSSVYDREFARRFRDFSYFDFLDGADVTESKSNFKADVLSVLTINQKKYAEMYRVFLVTDEDDPITYNYDMTETTGAQSVTNVKGQQTNTVGSHTDQYGGETNTRKVAPFNSATYQADSQDESSGHSDVFGQRSDTEGSRTDTTNSTAWTLTRKGNIGVQTAGDIMRIHTDYWTNRFKFVDMIFNDICAQLLLIED